MIEPFKCVDRNHRGESLHMAETWLEVVKDLNILEQHEKVQPIQIL
jgi:hypothetical protein